MCHNCGNNNCAGQCKPCLDCNNSDTVVVRTIRRKNDCDSILDTIKDLLVPEPGTCNIRLTGTTNGTNVVLLSSESNVTYSKDGLNFVNSNVFVGESCGNHVYFVRNDAGCLASVRLTVNCNCNPNWNPKVPLISDCINGFLNVMWEDGCGQQEWRPTTTACTDTVDFCNQNKLTLLPYEITCQAGGISRVTVIVTGNNGNLVQFFNPVTAQWEAANNGLNSHIFNTPSNGQSITYKARVNGCTMDFQGTITACSPTNQEFSATRQQTINCPTGCEQATILFTKTYYGSTQAIADTNAATDPLFLQQAGVYAATNCSCGSFSVSVLSAACDL